MKKKKRKDSTKTQKEGAVSIIKKGDSIKNLRRNSTKIQRGNSTKNLRGFSTDKEGTIPITWEERVQRYKEGVQPST